MAKKGKTPPDYQLRVTYADANRVRMHLLSEDVQTLNKQDVQILLKILDDVYPIRERRIFRIWKPFLIGVGIGVLLVLGLGRLF